MAKAVLAQGRVRQSADEVAAAQRQLAAAAAYACDLEHKLAAAQQELPDLTQV